MNCKPGDLAVIVNAANFANQGKLVSVLRLYKRGEILSGHRVRYATNDVQWPCWVIESLGGPLDLGSGKKHHLHVCEDVRMRPIRPGKEPTTTEREVEHAA